MRKLSLATMLTLGSVAAFADINHAQLVNLPFGGTGAAAGANISQLETGETTFGYGAQGPPTNNVLADDFDAGAGFNVTGISVFSYVTGSTVPTTTGVNWALGAAPTTALTTTNVAGTFWSVGGQAVYRTNVGDTFSTNRRVVVTTVTGLNINLAGINYLSFSVNPGNFSPPLPTSLAVYGKNAQQSLAGGAFAPVLNGSVGADMAFIIHGTAVPEPATMAALGLGVAALLRRRKKA